MRSTSTFRLVIPGDNRLSLGAKVLQPFKAWRLALKASSGGAAKLERRLSPRSLNVSIRGVEEPVVAVDQLIAAYRAAPLPLSEVFLVRRAVDATGELTDPAPDPRMPETADYPDAESFWSAVFDPQLAPPPSEDPAGMLALTTFKDGQVLYETRGMPLYLEGLTIAYGTPEIEVLPPDERSAEVSKALWRSFKAAFPPGTAPIFFNGAGEKHQVIKVRHGQRISYSFALSRDPDKVGLFAVRYPKGFRFREYELMRGVERAIDELGLEPVILWNRGGLYILNIWERLP